MECEQDRKRNFGRKMTRAKEDSEDVSDGAVARRTAQRSFFLHFRKLHSRRRRCWWWTNERRKLVALVDIFRLVETDSGHCGDGQRFAASEDFEPKVGVVVVVVEEEDKEV